MFISTMQLQRKMDETIRRVSNGELINIYVYFYIVYEQNTNINRLVGPFVYHAEWNSPVNYLKCSGLNLQFLHRTFRSLY